MQNMANPDQRVSFDSSNSTFTVTTSNNCIVAVLNSAGGGALAEGNAQASIVEEKGPLGLPGRSITVGGKRMLAGDYIEACSN
jgi:hypothetical protein